MKEQQLLRSICYQFNHARKSEVRTHEVWKTTSSGPRENQNVSELLTTVLMQMTDQMREEQEKAFPSMGEALAEDQNMLQI